MSERSVPAPHPDQLAAARMGLHFRAEECGFDVSSPEGQEFVEAVANNIAQCKAESLWLSNIIHLADIPEANEQ